MNWKKRPRTFRRDSSSRYDDHNTVEQGEAATVRADGGADAPCRTWHCEESAKTSRQAGRQATITRMKSLDEEYRTTHSDRAQPDLSCDRRLVTRALFEHRG